MNNVPEIRFKGYAAAWVQRKLGEVVEKLKSYPLSRDVECEKETGYRYIHYGDIHKQVADLITCDEQLPYIKHGDYLSLNQGDLILADASEDYTGIAEPCVILHEPNNKIIAGLHTIALRPQNASPLYLYYLFHTEDFKKFGGHVGTGLKVFGITYNNLSLYTTNFPDLSEQTTIGNFFRVLDDIITQNQRKLDGLRELRKAYLQQMFPQTEECVPRMRFTEFTSEWKTKKASELFISVSEKNHPYLPVLSASQERGMVLRDEIGIDIKYDETALGSYKRIQPGQFAIHLRSFQGGFAYSSFDGITSPAYTILDFHNRAEQDSNYWKEIFVSTIFIKRLETITYGIRDGRSISFSDFATLSFTYPSKEEQTAIGSFFRNLDEQIAVQVMKLERLRQLKAAYLQKMFI